MNSKIQRDPAIEWVDEPPILESLRANPGRWAKVITATPSGGVSNTVNAIRTGRMAAARPAGSFEAVSRRVGVGADGEKLSDVYARYIGDSAGAS